MSASAAPTLDYANRSANGSLDSTTEQSPLALGILWLPYIVFTIVLLSLIAMSFLRFHCERGQQYRRRQEEMGDKQQHLDNMRLLASDGPQPNGGPSGCVPEQYNLFMQYSQILPDEDVDDEFTSTRSRSAINGRKGGQSRRPIVFTFNSNGSMVDVRCDEEERTNTFRLIPNADSAGGDDVSVVEIDLGNGDLDDLEPCLPPSSSTRHRERRYDDRLSPNSAGSWAIGGDGRSLGAGARSDGRRPASSSEYAGQNHLDPLSPLDRHRRNFPQSTLPAASTHQPRQQPSGSRLDAVPPSHSHHAHPHRHHHHHHPYHQQHQTSASHRSTLFAPLDSSQRHRREHSSEEEINCAAEALLLWQKRV